MGQSTSADHEPSASERVRDLRHEYADAGLDVGDLAADPVTSFERWIEQAVEAGIHEPNAMVVSTADASGRPSSRMVLLKGFDERGFVFFTNTASRKGSELADNPWCALLMPWHPLERQVRIEGRATRLEQREVEDYFDARPRRSRLGAWASPQSRPVADRAELEASYAAVVERFGEDGDASDVPVPPEWGGYRVAPETVEFWQGRPGRLHDRLVYGRRPEGGWTLTRLAP